MKLFYFCLEVLESGDGEINDILMGPVDQEELDVEEEDLPNNKEKNRERAKEKKDLPKACGSCQPCLGKHMCINRRLL